MLKLLSGLRGFAGAIVGLKLLSLLCSEVAAQDKLMELFGTGESRSPLQFIIIQSCLLLMKGSLQEFSAAFGARAHTSICRMLVSCPGIRGNGFSTSTFIQESLSARAYSWCQDQC